MVGECGVDVEQEPVEDVLEDSPHEVAEEERRHSIEEGFRDNATSKRGLDRCRRIHDERR